MKTSNIHMCGQRPNFKLLMVPILSWIIKLLFFVIHSQILRVYWRQQQISTISADGLPDWKWNVWISGVQRLSVASWRVWKSRGEAGVLVQIDHLNVTSGTKFTRAMSCQKMPKNKDEEDKCDTLKIMVSTVKSFSTVVISRGKMAGLRFCRFSITAGDRFTTHSVILSP
jgi:hypothetical protein